jgi:glycosyltransferase involved in cell wall biosynthesis
MVISRAAVAICTHNPDFIKLARVLQAIQQNDGNFRILLINNASKLNLLPSVNESKRLIVATEEKLGNSYARKKAIDLCKKDELLIFVDDDNYIASDYILTAIRIANNHPDWGCFGGNQIQHPQLSVSRFKRIFLPYLGIRSLGTEERETSATYNWDPLEPIGAGMCIRPELHQFISRQIIKSDSSYFQLGRSGKGLISGEDSFIARQASGLGLKWGYSPKLVLTHDIRHNRLKLIYLIKLFYSYGLSDVKLNSALNVMPRPPYPSTFVEAALHLVWNLNKGPFGWILGLRSIGQYLGKLKKA